MKFNIIAARSSNNKIGNDMELPWPRLPEDMTHFRRKTMGHPVIMGRRTWQSMKCSPLAGRPNYIVSSTLDRIENHDDVIVVPSLQHALDDIALRDDVSHTPWVIGGGQLYAEALAHPDASKLHLTEVQLTVPGDVDFPQIDERRWKPIEDISGYSGSTNIHYCFTVYARHQKPTYPKPLR